MARFLCLVLAVCACLLADGARAAERTSAVVNRAAERSSTVISRDWTFTPGNPAAAQRSQRS